MNYIRYTVVFIRRWNTPTACLFLHKVRGHDVKSHNENLLLILPSWFKLPNLFNSSNAIEIVEHGYREPLNVWEMEITWDSLKNPVKKPMCPPCGCNAMITCSFSNTSSNGKAFLLEVMQIFLLNYRIIQCAEKERRFSNAFNVFEAFCKDISNTMKLSYSNALLFHNHILWMWSLRQSLWWFCFYWAHQGYRSCVLLQGVWVHLHALISFFSCCLQGLCDRTHTTVCPSLYSQSITHKGCKDK